MRRTGIWGSNGQNPNVEKMLSMRPGALTVIYDYLSHNAAQRYRAENPDGMLIVRFMHPKNWWQNPAESARNYAAELLAKLPEIDALGAYWYFANELNLHYENGWDISQQYRCETPAFYSTAADWTRLVIDAVKQSRPDTKAVMFPFAFGHNEDGAPVDGVPQAGWAGYDYFADLVRDYFNGILCGHYYWGDSGGAKQARLYDDNLSAWYAFRWRKVLELFAVRYAMPETQIIIDECGNFDTTLPTFADDIIYYTRESLKNEKVLAVTPFLWSDPTGNAGNVLNDWQRCPALDTLVARLAALPDVDVPENTEPPPNPPEEKMKIYDIDGNLRDEAWLAQNWGIEISETLATYDSNFKLVEVREREGAAIYPVQVLDKSGAPASGRLVWRHYPGAPNNWQSAPDIPEPPEARNGAVYGVSKDDGMVEFGLGGGDYAGPGDGVSSIWVSQNNVGTDVVRKLGMLPNTNHRTLKLVFRWIDNNDGGETPPVEPPDDENWLCRFTKLLCELFCGTKS